MKKCMNCNAIIDDGANFCNSCGFRINDMPPSGNKAPEPTSKKGFRKPIILLSIIVILAAAGVITAFTFLGSRKNKEAFRYIKGDELTCSSLTSIKPVELSDGYEAEEYSRSYMAFYRLNNIINLSGDGSKVFYPDKLSDTAYDLYYMDLSSKDQKKEKIDSDVEAYAINKKGSLVFYIKKDNLYVHDLDERNKLDNNVNDFYINEDGSRLIYVNDGGDLYYKAGDKEKDRIDTITDIQFISETYDRIYYMKDNNLYIWTEEDGKERILSAISRIIQIYDTGEIYYLKEKEYTNNLAEFVDDSMYSYDALLTEPVEPLYPSYDNYKPDIPFPVEPDYSDFYDYWGYVDWDAYYDAYDIYSQESNSYYEAWDSLYYDAVEEYERAYDEYEIAYNEYSNKIFRDELRDQLKNETVTITNRILCYFNGEKSTEISDTYYDYMDYGSLKPVLIYSSYKKTDLPKMDITDVQYTDDVYTYALSSNDEAPDIYALIEGKTAKIGDDTGYSYGVSSSGDKIYYLDDRDEEEDFGNLYEITVTGDILGKPSLYDRDVNFYTLMGNNDAAYYVKDRKDASGDLYLNKTRIDFDVNCYQLYSINSTNSILYMTDYDNESEEGTLMLYNGSKTIEIGDDVHAFDAADDKCIVYLQDYNLERHRGDAFLYDGSKKRKAVDEDVSLILSVQGK